MSQRILYLVRHGESDFDSEESVLTPRGDQWDPPLSAKGREQAGLLARRLVTMETPAAVYTSTMQRTRQTIAPYAELSGTEIHEEPDLIEAYIGEWERRSFGEILRSDESLLHRVRNQESLWGQAPGVEALAPFRGRVRAAIEGILQRHPAGNVVVVCHGGVINAYIAPFFGLDHEMFFLPENTSVNSVIVDGQDRRVRFLNDVLHLTDPHLFD